MLAETLLLCGFAFMAGMVDAVAGGGGLIQVPALFALFPGASPAMLLGTNKLAAIAGTATATLRYARSVEMPWRALRWTALTAFCMAAAGALLVTAVPGDVFKPIGVVALLLVAVATVARRRVGVSVVVGKPRPGAERAFGGLVGFYDGLLGPGAGSFFTFGFVKWFGRDFLSAAAAAKVLNLASNGGALALFMYLGSVNYAIALPMMLANILGGYAGAALAIRGGAGFVRKIFLVVVFGLIAKLLLDLLR